MPPTYEQQQMYFAHIFWFWMSVISHGCLEPCTGVGGLGFQLTGQDHILPLDGRSYRCQYPSAGESGWDARVTLVSA